MNTKSNPTKNLQIIAITTLLLAACSAASEGNVNSPQIEVNASNQESQVVNSEELNQEENGNEETTQDITETTQNDLELITGQDPPSRAASEFSTDFSIHTIDYSDVLSGGPPKDGIPAVDKPEFVSVAEADEWIDDVEPVVLLSHNGEVKAYPIQILIWHEIVNDFIGGEPVVVTFCPLCNTAIVFSGLVNGVESDFGTTGRLRFSNLIMYDRQTETWWQQASGEAVAGVLTGTQLQFLPASLVSWAQYKEAHPSTLVLSRNTGFVRQYGANPYIGYDNINRPPFLYFGPDTPGELPATARVITVDLNEEAAAYPYDTLAEFQVLNDNVGGEDIVVIWQSGTASALDANKIASGRDIGAADVFSRNLNGQTLTFTLVGEDIVDDQTSSVWNVLGQAVSGELEGQILEQVVAINHFWFSWAAFRPDTRVYTP